MTEVEERYQRGKIYCLRSHQTDLVYIGSTVQSLSKRMGGHRDDYKRWLKGTFSYVTSFEIIKYADHYIELVESYPCKTKAELERREGQVMRDTENCCNRIIAGRTPFQWYIDNKDKIDEYRAEWRAKNKDKVAEQKLKYYIDNKDKIDKYRAEWRDKNKDKVAGYHAKNKEKRIEYRDKNRDKNNEKKREKVQCECGSEVNRSCLARHRKTEKHQKWVEQKSE